MDDLRPNLEPGNPDGHTVLRYLVEEKRMPLELAIDRVYSAIAKYQHEFRSSQSKLILGSVVTGALSLPIALPLGLPSALVAGSIATAIYTWMELGTQRDRLKPEYVTLKQSHLLENFIKFLAVNLAHQRQQHQPQSGHLLGVQPRVSEITTKTIIAAYESTVMQVSQGDHLDTNASDPVLAIFVINLRSHTNFLPDWVLHSLQELEAAEQQRRQHVSRASEYMWGNLSEQQTAPALAPSMNYTQHQSPPHPTSTREPWEGEQSQGKRPEERPPISKAIGSNTRLNAIPAAVVTASPETVNPSPVRYLLGDRLRSVLIAAVSGGGKDVLLSNALREFLTLYPDFTAVVMDCKADPKETGYYANLPRVTVYRLDVATASESTALAWIDAALDDFNNRGEKALLVCNEGIDVRALSKRYCDVISSFVSSGDSRQKYAWEAGHSGHAVDLRISGPARSRFRPLAIAVQGEEMQVEALMQSRWLADTANDMRAIEAEMRRSPVHRAWTDGRRWYAMPVLTNYSGYDRDSRSFLGSDGREPGSDDCEPLNRGRGDGFSDSEPGSDDCEPDSNSREPGLNRAEPGLNRAEPLNHEPGAQPLNRTQGDGFSGSDGREPGSGAEPLFTPKRLTRQQILELVQLLKNCDRNLTQIVEGLWEVTKGGSAAWQSARDEYRQLTGE